ncbi:DUF6114 domain-containing protein [Streptomyces sp. NPDC002588]|uniref:DUF6114 domain-containing protein n=1 Tax=Streptomyces sp. NPDC002588 TaxID=3154419 RepID=UPI00331943F7
MSAETPAAPGQFTRRRLQFRAWRGTRPFWAGLFVLIAGFPIMYFPYAHLQIGHLTIAMSTTAGAGSLIIGVLLVVLGISLWFQKHIRTFAGVAAILLALVSLPVSNFGGFIVGFLFGMIGGAMAIAWAPGTPPEPQAVQEDAQGQGGAPEGAVTDPLQADGSGYATTDLSKHDGGTDLGGAGDRVGEPNDLSGTSPANGANGRHSVG